MAHALVQTKPPLPEPEIVVGMPAAVEDPAEKVAVIVVHGMGQQVPFETIDGVARSLWQKAAESTGPDRYVPGKVIARTAKPGDQVVRRAELCLRGPAGSERRVHIYEAYWAPLTEGKISLREVTTFLLTAAWLGVVNGMERGGFRRWLFGGWQTFRVRWWPVVGGFLYAAAVFLSLIAMNVAIGVVTAARALTAAPSRWPTNALLADLTVDIGLFAFFGAMMVIGLVIPLRQREKQTRRGRRWRLRPAARSLIWTLVWLAMTAAIVTGLLIVWHMGRHQDPGAAMFWQGKLLDQVVVSGWSGSTPKLNSWSLVVTWGLAVLVSMAARWFLLEYVGDVAIYVSSHTVSRFWETRQAIRELALKVARDVYGAQKGDVPGPEAEEASAAYAGEGPPLPERPRLEAEAARDAERRIAEAVAERRRRAGSPPEPRAPEAPLPATLEFDYRSVIIVAHSLGSVVAYDMLNGMINEDALAGHPLRVVHRTKLLLTFGSPLNKTAFIFRSQQPERAAVREGLAAAVQPLIVDFSFRPRRWVNLWSPNDWVSGPLTYYDPAKPPPSPPHIANRIDADASIPLLAHTEYWTNPALIDELYAAITTGSSSGDE